MKTITDLLIDYEASCEQSNTEYETWRKENPKASCSEYKGKKVDYEWHSSKIREYIKTKFNLTEKQTNYIMSEAYDRYHSTFSEMFYGAEGVAELVTGFPKN